MNILNAFIRHNKEIEYFNYSLDRIVEFYNDIFIASLLKDDNTSKSHENDIKNIIHKELDCFEFKQGKRFIKKEMNSLGIKKIHSELGHITNNWRIDWAWIMHHIFYDYSNIRIALSLLEDTNNQNVFVYKYVPNNYYNFAENIYLKDNLTREPRIFNLNKLFKNGSGLKEKTSKFKPVIGVTLWSGFSNECWDLTELRKYDTNYYWDKEKKWFYLKPLKSNHQKLGIKVSIGNKSYEV